MDKSQLVEIACLYYEKKMTQQDIAIRLGLSRMAISRAIQRCHQEGIVEIKINYENSYVMLEEEILQKYHIEKALIVPFDNDQKVLRRFLKEGACNILHQYIHDHQTIGVGWGSTLHSLHKFIPHANKKSYPNTLFVPLLGGYGNTDLKVNANNIASDLANYYDSKTLMLHAPAIVDKKSLKNSLCSDKHIQEIFNQYQQLDLALISIGNPAYEEATVYQSGYFSYGDIKELKDANIQCDIVSCIYLDGQGKEHQLELLERTIGISAELFKKIPTVIAIAGGCNKHHAIQLALKNNAIHVLVTDEMTARMLLEE
ncbi:MAG: sugar-binding transcriptional regulator [Eubacteriales bacterium]